ncbi:MAG: hypothetical protein MHMPM18_002540, partial [Marteilia pararefringens]
MKKDETSHSESSESKKKDSNINGGDDEDEEEEANLKCVVCGAEAWSVHYGVLCCEGCKGFFRRVIARKQRPRSCENGELCQVRVENRTKCQWCRLQKCLTMGMSHDSIILGRRSKALKSFIERNKNSSTTTSTTSTSSTMTRRRRRSNSDGMIERNCCELLLNENSRRSSSAESNSGDLRLDLLSPRNNSSRSSHISPVIIGDSTRNIDNNQQLHFHQNLIN